MQGGQPLKLLDLTIPDAWVDYNGHMNDAAYALAFSQAVDALLDAFGIDAGYRERERYAVFTLEVHICYLREAHGGDRVTVDAQLLDRDAKRMHVLMRLCGADGAVKATAEQMLMGMDTAAGRAAPFRAPIAERIAALAEEHAALVQPEQAGRRIGIRR